jgi:hypothetical protein
LFRPASGALQSSWHPPGGAHISLAAQQGQYIALAYGSAEVQVLYCSGGTGRLQEERVLALPQQASALALFQLSGGSGAAGEVRCGPVLLPRDWNSDLLLSVPATSTPFADSPVPTWPAAL